MIMMMMMMIIIIIIIIIMVYRHFLSTQRNTGVSMMSVGSDFPLYTR